ncbi:MAG: sugar phosphate isomerase/epimerase [Clostridia bacterium]|nr:sugar phosphate isomerase/epimerase [Clostridia bacterium]
MKLSIDLEYHVHSFELPFLKRLKELGYEGVDFCFHPLVFVGGKEETIISQIKENLDKAGLVCSQVHLPFYDLTLPSTCHDEWVEHQMQGALKLMKVLDCKWGAWHPVSATECGHDRKVAMKANREMLKRHLETAEKYGVGIAVENIFAPFFSSVVEDHIELIESMHSPLVGACWDFGHANLQVSERGRVEDFRMIADKIKILHVDDNHACEDRHLAPGFGNVQFNELLPILFGTGFEGYFNMECNIPLRNPAITDLYCEAMVKCAKILIEESGGTVG